MSAGRLFQIAGAAHRKAREPVTVLMRVAHGKLELEPRKSAWRPVHCQKCR